MAKLFANSVDPDQMLHSVASDLGLHCLPITLLRVSRLQWVNLLILFLGRLSPLLALNQIFCKHFHQKLITALLGSADGENDCRNYFMINLHKNYVAEL